MENTTAIYLKQSINALSENIKLGNKTNKILAITNLMSLGILTHEEALKDEDYKEFISEIKNPNVITAKIKR